MISYFKAQFSGGYVEGVAVEGGRFVACVCWTYPKGQRDTLWCGTAPRAHGAMEKLKKLGFPVELTMPLPISRAEYRAIPVKQKLGPASGRMKRQIPF